MPYHDCDSTHTIYASLLVPFSENECALVMQFTPTHEPSSAAPTDPPSPPPTYFPTSAPTYEPMRQVDENVEGTTFVIYFGVSRERRPFTRLRTLQRSEKCLDRAQQDFVQSRFEFHANNVYRRLLGSSTDPGSSTASFANIKITGQKDLSDGDCEEIQVIYDQRMEYNVGRNDETTLSEIIQLPLESEADHDEFAQDLIDESANTEVAFKFALVTGVSAADVTQEGLSTRAPTSSPSISTAPTASPSDSPSG